MTQKISCTDIFYNNLFKIAIKKNSKTPAFTGWTTPKNQFKNINNKHFNVGLPTGSTNGLIT